MLCFPALHRATETYYVFEGMTYEPTEIASVNLNDLAWVMSIVFLCVHKSILSFISSSLALF
jgi:hypothetical protein